ncbi:hypothetical protein POM88_038592 [Heracleum sosnowskyi]|uniref:Serine-threonine/tyrosine-protein kinase catalytic domain-containing protein n=1 Tax=Heracleum sosnowskyi TaxID=360622 RepID=A0AAD8M716_9APIA|nr:hypothetical protein POM88_038592 [Heracleum sosnowskyi]
MKQTKIQWPPLLSLIWTIWSKADHLLLLDLQPTNDLGDGSSRGGKSPYSAVVVKRYRKMNNVGREDFQEHMRRLGKFRHPNLLPLVAYYYRKEEKLMVSDYVANGSLAFHPKTNKSN